MISEACSLCRQTGDIFDFWVKLKESEQIYLWCPQTSWGISWTNIVVSHLSYRSIGIALTESTFTWHLGCGVCIEKVTELYVAWVSHSYHPSNWGSLIVKGFRSAFVIAVRLRHWGEKKQVISCHLRGHQKTAQRREETSSVFVCVVNASRTQLLTFKLVKSRWVITNSLWPFSS